ncbi:MAG: hypothetical protein AB8F94_23195 [Saprospiraceae bacterium]
MSNKNFDKNLKKGLENYESELDVDSFWASIESDVDEINREEKQKRILPFFLLFLLIGFSVSILLGLGFIGRNKGRDLVKNEKEEIEFDLSNDVEIENKILKVENEAVKTKTIPINFEEKEDLNELGNSFEFSSFSRKYVTPKNTFLEDKKRDILLELEKNEQLEVFVLDKNILAESKKEEEPNITFTSLERNLFLLKNESSNLSLDGVEKHVEFNKEELDSEKFKIEILSGFSFVNRLLENNNSDNQALFNLRNETESTHGAINISVLGTWKPKPFLSISTGLNFTQINEQFKFQGEIIQKDSIENDIVAFQININEDSIAIFGDQVFDRKFNHNKLYFNKYRMIDIPVLIGFEKRIKKFSLGGRAGVFVNLKLKTSGMIFQATDSFVNLNSNQGEVFRSNVQLSYYFGGVVKYHLKKQLAISAQPNFRVFPKNFSVTNTFTNQNYRLFGLNLGLEYEF